MHLFKLKKNYDNLKKNIENNKIYKMTELSVVYTNDEKPATGFLEPAILFITT